MASVSGFTNFNEAAATLRDIKRHLFGSRPILNGFGLAAVIVGYIGMRVFWSHIPFWKMRDLFPADGNSWADPAVYLAFRLLSDGICIPLVIFFSSIILWANIETRMATRFSHKLAKQVDTSERCPIGLTIAAHAMTYQDGGVTTTAEWRSVVDLFPSGNFWIFLLLCQPIVIPKRFFKDIAAERAFIAEALSYMTDDARARSSGAGKFIEAESP